MEGNFPTNTYNRKCSIVVKKKYDGFLFRISSAYNLIQSGKKSNSTYKRTSIIEPKSTYLFLFSEYGVKLAKDDLFANILPNMLELTDYEEKYMTPEERKNRGPVYFYLFGRNVHS